MPYWFGIAGPKFNKDRRKVRNLPHQHARRAFREKRGGYVAKDPYRKPTQVDRARSPRGTSDLPLRNSAKKRPYVSNMACSIGAERRKRHIGWCAVSLQVGMKRLGSPCFYCVVHRPAKLFFREDPLPSFFQSRWSRSESFSGDCLPKTQLPANSQEDV